MLEERGQLFMEAQQSPLDLRGLAVPLYERKKQLSEAGPKTEPPGKKPMNKEKA